MKQSLNLVQLVNYVYMTSLDSQFKSMLHLVNLLL